MVNIKRVLISLGVIFASIIIASFLTNIIGVIFFENSSSQFPFGDEGVILIWGIFTIIVAIPLRKFIPPSENLDELLKEFE